MHLRLGYANTRAVFISVSAKRCFPFYWLMGWLKIDGGMECLVGPSFFLKVFIFQKH